MLNDLQEIERLKDEQNAIILAHNYQSRAIQEIADFIGDSLELCLKASEIEESDMIVFCGVDFMAETAAIINPSKKVLIPDRYAECPMAHMLSAEDVKNAKGMYPDAAVVLYVNTRAEAKTEADILCTSANAVGVVESLFHEKILFGPDLNLARYVSRKLNKEIIPIPADGYCYVHKMIHLGDLIFIKDQHPDAEVLAHPECNLEVQKAADQVLSTGDMIRHVAHSTKKNFIIATELDMSTRLKRENPDKTFIPALSDAICENMKLHTLEKVKNCLLNEEFVIQPDAKIAAKAKIAIKRMLEVSKKSSSKNGKIIKVCE